jgi:uroporphyrinogen-III synthase
MVMTQTRATTHRERAQALSSEAVVLLSKAAVRACMDWPFNDFHGPIYAVGKATAALASELFERNVCVPLHESSEGLLAETALASHASVSILTAPDGREQLAPALCARGVAVTQYFVYERRVVQLDPIERAMLQHEQARMVLTASSVAILNQLHEQLQLIPAECLRRPLLVNSARVAERAQMLGFQEVVVAPSPSVESAVLTALERFAA